MKKWVGFVIFLGLLFFLSACSKNEQQVLDNKLDMGGSTTLAPIMNSAISAYVHRHPEANLSYNSMGTSAGIKNLSTGVFHLAGSSRELTKDELDSQLRAIPIALDALVIIVHGDLPIQDLSRQQIADIFNGTISNWSILGGPDAPIVLVKREESSGSYSAFQELFLQAVYEKGSPQAEYSSQGFSTSSNGDLNLKVSQTENSIAYSGVSYVEESLKSGANLKSILVDGFDPSIENIEMGTYPAIRSLYLVRTQNEISPLAQSFVDFLLSDEGQDLVVGAGYLPVPQF